jgi:hypothetical protein
MFAVEFKLCDATNPGTKATNTGEKDRPCTEVGCTNGTCIDGIDLQHSWLCSALCDEHGIVSQHCIACSGVVTAPQSIAYPAIAIAMTKSKICFARCISIKLDALCL